MHEFPLVVQSMRPVRVNIIRRVFTAPVITGISEAFLDWSWEQLRIIFKVNYLENKHIRPDGDFTADFWSGYIQAEYAIRSYWTVYGRHENSYGEDDTEIIRLIPKFVSRRNLFGDRWDIATSHALTVEIADTETVTSDFGQYRLQWSAVIP